MMSLLLSPLLLLSLTASSVSAGSSVTFGQFCPEISFNHAYDKYEIAIPISLSKKFGAFDVSGNAALATKESGLTVVARRDSETSGVVSLLCKTFERCWRLKLAISSNPKMISHSLNFYSASSMSQAAALTSLTSGSLVKPNCNSGWKVFQKRVDGSLSFVQNYRTYERGFGDPDSNYWMGLHNLHSATATGTHTSGCRLRVTAVANDNKHYSAEYSHFQVMHSATYYKVYIAGPVKGNTIKRIEIANGYRFTTYDRDHDIYKGQCSQLFGYGGWWYKNCHAFNPNGAYTRRNLNDPTFACIWLTKRHYQTIKSITMMFKCD